MKAGRNPGHMYWLDPEAVLRSRESVVFSGVHSLEQNVYFLPEDSGVAIAIYVSQPVTREMKVACSGREPIQSLHKAFDCLSNVRILSFQADKEVYTYHGVWLITAINTESEDQATFTMFNMPG